MRAIRHFYTDLNELVWGPAGFYDAFSLDNGEWAAKKYLAIDQGPMIVMIENYSDIKIGDIIETFEEVSTNRKL